jgi:hypothetical protein
MTEETLPGCDGFHLGPVNSSTAEPHLESGKRVEVRRHLQGEEHLSFGRHSGDMYYTLHGGSFLKGCVFSVQSFLMFYLPRLLGTLFVARVKKTT